MGCGPSSTRVVANEKEKSKRQIRRQLLTGGDCSPDIEDAFYVITNGCKNVLFPSELVPIMALTFDAFPLGISSLVIDDDHPTEIKLPVAACSIHDNARIVCFSSDKLITCASNTLSQGDTETLIKNALNWLPSSRTVLTPMLIAGVNKKNAIEVKQTMQTLGFFVELSETLIITNKYQILVLMSDYCLNGDEMTQLSEYLKNGGALVCFYHQYEQDENIIPMNKFLVQYGLSFTFCSLNFSSNALVEVTIPPIYQDLRKQVFPAFAEHFREMMTELDINTSELDDLVTVMRYYVIVLGDDQSDIIVDTYTSILNYLTYTNFKTDNNEVCPKLNHSILASLIQSMHTKVPLNKLGTFPSATLFPGLPPEGSNKYKDYQVEVHLIDEGLMSTGFWLTTDCVSTVTYESEGEIPPGIEIQVGIHSQSLLSKPGPLKRWPNVVFTFPLVNRETKIATPFGGMIFISATKPMKSTPKSINLKFHKVIKYPRAISGKPKFYEKTKDLDVPWAEICTKSVFLTVPTANFKMVEDFQPIFDLLEKLASAIKELMDVTDKRPYRIIFDVDTLDGQPVADYPIVLLKSDCEEILLDTNRVTMPMFRMVTMMAIVNIPEGHLDAMTEYAAGSVIAANILQKKFNWFDPTEYGDIMHINLFSELWAISQHDPGVILKVLKSYANKKRDNNNVEEDKWTKFVADLCIAGDCDYTNFIDKARPIPLNITERVSNLSRPVFHGLRDEEVESPLSSIVE